MSPGILSVPWDPLLLRMRFYSMHINTLTLGLKVSLGNIRAKPLNAIQEYSYVHYVSHPSVGAQWPSVQIHFSREAKHTDTTNLAQDTNSLVPISHGLHMYGCKDAYSTYAVVEIRMYRVHQHRVQYVQSWLPQGSPRVDQRKPLTLREVVVS